MDNSYTRIYLNKSSYQVSYDTLNDIILILILINESKLFFNSALHFIKQIKDVEPIGLGILKDCFDIMLKLGFIIKDDNQYYVSDHIHILKSYKDIEYMDKNNINANQFARYEKLKKIRIKI